MKRILMFIFISLFAMSIAVSSLMCVASLGAIIIGKFSYDPDTYTFGVLIIPVVIYAWVAWLSSPSIKRIRNILYGERDNSRDEV